MWTFLTTPMMSVNCRLTKRTRASSAAANTWSLSAIFCESVIVDTNSTPSCWIAAQRGADLERELQIETHLGIFQVGVAQEFLNALEAVDQGVAVDIQIPCCPHVVAARTQECVERAHELGPTRHVRNLERPEHVALERAELGIVGQVEDQPQRAESRE